MEDSDINSKRFEWFYRQRAYPYEFVPQTQRLKALSELDRMQPKASSSKTRIHTAAAASLSSSQWTAIGPQPIGVAPNQYTGRVNTLAIHPSDPNTVYLGSDGGGIWKTTDSGTTWTPLTDTQPSLTIRSIALATSNPNIVYAATGYSSSGSEYGAGILKSLDGGTTWTQIGGPFVQGTYVQTVYSVAVQPGGSQVVLAAAAGIFRSTDGGSTWNSVLPDNAYTQILFDPTNGTHAIAIGLAGIYQSHDGGQTWTVSNGTGVNVLPLSQFSWITLAIAPSNPNVLYAAGRLSSTSAPAFYKSVDSGSNWTPINPPANDTIDYWGWSLAVHPGNPNILYAGSLSIHSTFDGGATWKDVSANVHVDHHVQAFTPDGSKLYIGNDGGVWSTTNPSSSSPAWTNLNTTQSNALLYPGFSIHPTDVNTMFAGAQDNGTLRYSGNVQGWNAVTCGDGGWTAIDYQQTQNVYVSCQNIAVLKSTSSGNTGSFTFAQSGIAATDRVSFIPPMVMDPVSPQRLYFGTYRLYQTANGAQAWAAISPALTNDAQYGSVTAIAVAASDPNTVYTGSTDGQIYVSRNALSGSGSSWASRSSGLPNRFVTQIAIHPQDPLTAYATFSGYGTPHLWKTTNGGASWTNMTGNLPDIPVNDILIDPDRVTVLYLATDIGVYQSFDSGASWIPLGSGLPRVVVSAIKLHRPSRTLRAVTYGRGAWDLWLPLSNQVTVTIAAVPSGAPFQLEDGSTYQAPVTFSWTSGSQHTVTWLAAAANQAGGRYVFQSWADGGANPRTITVPSANAIYTANEKAQYLLNATVTPSSAGSLTRTPSSADGYYDAGTSVTLAATANTGYRFAFFTGDVTGNSPQTVVMSAPRTVTAQFACNYQFQGTIPSSVGPGATAGLVVWTAGAGCAATITSDASWIVVGQPTVTGGTGSTAFSIGQNTGVSSRAGTVTFAGSANYIYSVRVTQDASSSARPSITSLSPTSGSGSTQTFALQVYDANGYGNINWISATFFSSDSQAQCNIAISPAPGLAFLYLLPDSGSTYLGPVSIPGKSTLHNSSCMLNASGSSFSGSGNVFTVNISVSFSSAFAGSKYVSSYATDIGGSTAPSIVIGTWSVALTPSTSLSPISGSGSTQAFTFTFTDPAGYQDIAGAQLVINSTLATANSCYILFARPDVVSLADDGANHFSSTSLGAPAVLQNSQCSVLASLTSQSGSGNSAAFTVTVVFKTPFAGSKTIWSNVNNNAGASSGWQQLGNYTATVPPQGLTAQLVSPSSGTGQAHMFTFTSFDPLGAPDISGAQMVVNSTLTGVNSCYLLFSANNVVSLASDDGNSFSTSVLGRPGVLQNSQCSVYPGSSYQTQSGQNLSVTLLIAFKPSFAGVKNIYSSIQDNAGNRSPFPQLGTWTVPSSAPAASAVLLAGQTLTGPSQALTFLFSDPSGYANIGNTQIIVNPTQSTANSCAVGFNPAVGTLALTGDADSGSTLATLGQPSALENSQCIVNAAASSQFGAGNYLTLTLFVTMKNSGFQNIYAAGTQTGSWVVTSSSVMRPLAASPFTGAGIAGNSQSFTFTLSDPAGANDISGALMVLYPSLQGANACYILWGHSSNLISLASDNATSFTSAALGSTGLLQNGQCTVDPSKSFETQTGNTVNLTVAVSFNAVYKQFAQIYTWVNVQNQAAALSGWELLSRFSVQ